MSIIFDVTLSRKTLNTDSILGSYIKIIHVRIHYLRFIISLPIFFQRDFKFSRKFYWRNFATSSLYFPWVLKILINPRSVCKCRPIWREGRTMLVKSLYAIVIANQWKKDCFVRLIWDFSTCKSVHATSLGSRGNGNVPFPLFRPFRQRNFFSFSLSSFSAKMSRSINIEAGEKAWNTDGNERGRVITRAYWK